MPVSSPKRPTCARQTKNAQNRAVELSQLTGREDGQHDTDNPLAAFVRRFNRYTVRLVFAMAIRYNLRIPLAGGNGVQVKTPEVSYVNWLRKSMMAYLEGGQTLRWIVGVIGQDVVRAREVLTGLADYGDSERRRALTLALASPL